MRLNLTAAVVAVGLCLLVTGVVKAASTQVDDIRYTLQRGSSNVSPTPTSLDECMRRKAEMISAESATRTTGSIVYQCIVANRSIVTFRANPTCPALPAPQGRTVDCPAGTTGAYTQTRSYTSAPYPTCAVLGEWTPVEPPAGICVPVPPPTEQWTLCANEYAFCSFTGTRRVRFGLGTNWVERDLTAVGGGAACRIASFGSDPLPGVAKRCELRAQAPATGTASLSWIAPTQNTDGSSLSNLAGYRISYGLSADELIQTIQIENSAATAYTVGNLAPGTYYFAVRAYTSLGTESANSNVESKVVQ